MQHGYLIGVCSADGAVQASFVVHSSAQLVQCSAELADLGYAARNRHGAGANCRLRRGVPDGPAAVGDRAPSTALK